MSNIFGIVSTWKKQKKHKKKKKKKKKGKKSKFVGSGSNNWNQREGN